MSTAAVTLPPVKPLRADDKGEGAGGGGAATQTDAGKGTEGAGGKGATGAGAETVMSKAAATESKEGAKGAESTETKGEKESKAEKPAPVDYEKWAPKEVAGVKRPEPTVKAFREAGKKFGLSAEQMQGLVDFDDERTKVLAQEYREEHERTTAGWLEAAKADKSIGGAKWSETTADLERVMTKFGADAEFKKLLDESGYGNHPAFIRVFAAIGKAMREDKLVGGAKGAGAGATKKPTLPELLYGSSAPAKS